MSGSELKLIAQERTSGWVLPYKNDAGVGLRFLITYVFEAFGEAKISRVVFE